MTAATNSLPRDTADFLPTSLDSLVQRLFGKPVLQTEETADDSDKTFTVPTDVVWIPLTLWVELTTTGTGGDRQIAVEIQDGDSDVIAEFRAGIVQAASLTRKYLFSLNAADLTGFRDTDWLSNPLPYLVLPATYQIRVFDNNAVDAAADDMILQMLVSELIEI